MRGRQLFKKFKWIINGISYIFKFTPKFISNFIWANIDCYKGKTSITLRYCILKHRLAACGENIYIGPNVEIRFPEKITLGSNISINRGCYIDAAGGLTIDNDVAIAHQTSILTTDHVWERPDLPIKDQPVSYSSVHIQEDVWIGCGCRILSGIIIKRRSIIAAGAVVVKDVESNSIIGGVPAKLIKNIKGQL